MNAVVEQLISLGLCVEQCEIPESDDSIVTLTDCDKTVFVVGYNGRRYAFSIDGSDDGTRTLARLAREYAATIIARQSGDSLTREFLQGYATVEQFASAYKMHLGKADYYVFALYGENGDRLREYVEAMSCDGDVCADMTGGITAFCKVIINDSDYQSAGEFARVLLENLTEELPGTIKIGVGGVAHGLGELPLLYSYANSALKSGTEFDANACIYSYKDYAFVRILSQMSKTSMERYIVTVLDKNYRTLLQDDELMTAAEEFIKHSLNISETSRSMYVHRNTLIYRLDKIEKLTGLNIRDFNDAMTLRTAYLLYKLL